MMAIARPYPESFPGFRARRHGQACLLILLISAVSVAALAESFDVTGFSPDAVPAVPEGFVVTVPAREPLVRNVSMLAFDTRGRLFVGMGPQYRMPAKDTPGDAIVQLVDADADGTFDAAKTFAGPFHCVQGMAWKQGPRGPELWVANAPDLTIARDTNGDDEADEYVRVATGLGTLEHALDALVFAPDGRLWMGKGDTPSFGSAPRAFRELASVAAGVGAVNDCQAVTFAAAAWPAAWRESYRVPRDGHTGGGIVRCDADGRGLRIVCRGLRNPWGMAFDGGFDWLATDQDDVGGDRFVMPFVGAHFGMRHPWNNSWTGVDSLASVPACGPLFEGSGTGIVFQDDPSFPAPYRDVFFRADWLRGTVEMFRPAWQGAMLMPADGAVEPFIAVGDQKPLFRPTGMAVGPDGALWIGGWGSTYGWNGDATEGRVFRIAAADGPQLAEAAAKLAARPAVESRAVAQLTADFESPIAAVRVAAQDELLRRAAGDGHAATTTKSAILALATEAAVTAARPARQTWLLWTLGRMAADEAAADVFFTSLIEDATSRTPVSARVQAVRILADRAARRSGAARRLPSGVAAVLADAAPRVRFAAALAAADVADRGAVPALVSLAAGETDRLVHYAAWTALRDLVPADELRELLADERPGVRLAALLALLDGGRLDGAAVTAFADDTDPRVARTATAWLANTGYGLDDPATLIATIKRLDNRHVDYRLRLNLLQRLEGKRIDGQVRRRLEGMYIDRYREPPPTQDEVVPDEKAQEIAAVFWAVKPDQRTARAAWDFLGHDWPALADLVAAGFPRLGEHGLSELTNGLPRADPRRRARAVEALSGYAAGGHTLTADQTLVTSLAGAWADHPQPSCRAQVLACLAAIAPESWRKAEAARGLATTMLTEAARDPDPRLLDRVPAVAASLGVPVPMCVEPRPPATVADVVTLVPSADPLRGARLFADARGANCGACHRVGDLGVAGIGPELSDIGSRAHLAAIVESILQPSATIIEGYRVSTIVLDDGRSLTGLVLDDTPDTVRVIDTRGGSTAIHKTDIETRAVQPMSLMPAGYDRTLTPEELADLAAFLLCQTQPTRQVTQASSEPTRTIRPTAP
ncbi:MAG: c-type cytochrome [Planctomycetes bacterium]|nr:c-type cytochrome [Planctomycetota bacterium]